MIKRMLNDSINLNTCAFIQVVVVCVSARARGFSRDIALFHWGVHMYSNFHFDSNLAYFSLLNALFFPRLQSEGELVSLHFPQRPSVKHYSVPATPPKPLVSEF